MIKNSRKSLLLAVFFFVLGIGVSMFYQTFATNSGALEYPQNFDKVRLTYKHIQERYIEDVSDETLIDGAIKGMLDAIGDPYTSYMTPAEAADFDSSLQSSFEGIGAEVTMNGKNVTIVSPIKGSPAERSGLIPGDIILSVDGESVEGLSLTEAVLKIRGPKGSTVVVEILREGHKEPIAYSLVRDTIPLETVYADMLDDGIGKIEITQFSHKTAERFATEFWNLQEQGMKGLIVDVRNNPGGTLDSVVEISKLLIPNKGIIMQIEDHDGNKEVIHSTLEKELVPVVVIVDKGSASASEILAAALQESAGYQVVGVDSYGKGSVQTMERFKDGSEIKFTIAKWLTPEGNWVHQKGVIPNHVVELPEVFTVPRLPADETLQYDNNNTHVRSLQVMLQHLGYDTGRTDGYFSRQTEKAVTDFQSANGLAMTGIVTDKEAAAINDAVIKTLENSDTQLVKAVEVIKSQVKQ